MVAFNEVRCELTAVTGRANCVTLRYACGYQNQGECYVKTRGRRRREGRITERKHERELDRRGHCWNRKYEKRTDTRNKNGINMIYYYNTRKITEHGLRPVTLQNSVVTIVIVSNPAYTSAVL